MKILFKLMLIFLICVYIKLAVFAEQASQNLLYVEEPQVKSLYTDTYNPNRPEWNEFCPVEYQNAEFDKRKIVPYAKKVYQWENNYWVNRRTQFNSDVAKCDSIPQMDIKDRCYAKLRAVQYSQNENFEKSKSVQLQERQVQDALMYGFFMKTTPQNLNLKIDGNMNHNVNYHYW